MNFMFLPMTILNNDLTDVINELSTDCYDDNPLTTHGIHSEYFDFDSLKSLCEQVSYKERRLSVIHMNIQSLPSKFTKLKYFILITSRAGFTCDVILICETFLNNVNFDLYQLPGYTFLSNILCFNRGVESSTISSINFRILGNSKRFFDK